MILWLDRTEPRDDFYLVRFGKEHFVSQHGPEFVLNSSCARLGPVEGLTASPEAPLSCADGSWKFASSRPTLPSQVVREFCPREDSCLAGDCHLEHVQAFKCPPPRIGPCLDL